MKRLNFWLLALSIGFSSQCGNSYYGVISVENTSPIDRIAEVWLDIEPVFEKLNISFEDNIAIFNGRQRLAYQVIPGEDSDQLYLLLPLKAGQTRTLVIKKDDKIIDFQKRVQAVLYQQVGGTLADDVYKGGEFKAIDYLKVPDGHKDHNDYFRWEGPGWESERVGYRLYLDQRNTIDIFGKKVKYPVLHHIDERDETGKSIHSYHDMADWGMDIFKVGESMGVGTLGALEKGKLKKVAPVDSTFFHIYTNGPLLAGIDLGYFGWQLEDKKYNVMSRLTISAESRLTKHQVSFLGDAPAKIVTGMADHGNVEVLSGSGDHEWNYLALWGNQDIEGRLLGTVIFYRNNDLVELSKDKHSYLVELKTGATRTIDFYFGAAWELELKGVKTLDEFKNYLDSELILMNNPVEITYL